MKKTKTFLSILLVATMMAPLTFFAYAEPTDVRASIRTDEVSYLGEDIKFTLSVSEAENLLAMEVELEVDGNVLAELSVETYEGFIIMDDILWFSKGSSLWYGKVTLAYPAEGGGNEGFATDTSVDVADLIFGARTSGVAVLKLTSLKAFGYFGESSQVVEFDTVIDVCEATTIVEIVYSKYDLNKDGWVNPLDLGMVLLYCGFKEADKEWEEYIKIKDVWGAGVSAKMCDVNGDGVVDMLDLIDLFVNYTKV